jgi:uncharacterized repeat protein (TIGR03803 family)
MTRFGGVNGDGNVFSVGIDGTNYHNLLSFTGTGGAASGYDAYNNLTLSGTTLYGMTLEGGAYGNGNIFSVGIDGTNYQNLDSFTGRTGSANGAYPQGGLTISGTTLYGMTTGGGPTGGGNLFSVSTGGTNYQNLISFTITGGSAAGGAPTNSLTLSGTTLYGMTSNGGAHNWGNIFSVGTDGTNYQNLLSFTGTGGAASGIFAYDSLTLSGTTLYGVTEQGGNKGDGNVFSVGVNGTNYQNILSLTGTGGTASGRYADGSLTLSGTTLYGTTVQGGVHGWGNVFSVGIDGSGYEDLYSFTGLTDGTFPGGDLTISGGTLFGMEPGGGPNSNGTVFAIILPTPSPEPSTLAIVATGAAAMVSYRRRRRRRRPRQP